MKTLITRVAAVAGLLLTAVAGQAAQTYDVKFNFRSPAGEHPAGRYVAEVKDQTGGTRMLYLRNVETGKAVMFSPIAPIEKMQNTGPAVMKFQCSTTGCSLAEVWKDSNYGFAVRQRKATGADAERFAVVVPAETPAAE